MSGTARTGAFSADGTQLLTSGGDGTGALPVLLHGPAVLARSAHQRACPRSSATHTRSLTQRIPCSLPPPAPIRAAVYVWDLRTQRCLQRYTDEGCLNGTSLATSPDGGLFATGSSSGVVNLYSRAAVGGGGSGSAAAPRRTVFSESGSGGDWTMPEAPIAGAGMQAQAAGMLLLLPACCLLSLLLLLLGCAEMRAPGHPTRPFHHSRSPPHAHPHTAGKPLKTVMNLTTALDSLAFNHDSQMLVMASRLKRDSLR